MKDIWFVYKDAIISSFIAILIIIIGSIFNFNSITLNILFNIAPILIITFGIVMNKPRALCKLIRITNSKKSTTIKYDTCFNNIVITDNQFKDIINLFINKFSNKLNKKIINMDIGEYIDSSKVMIESIGYIEIQYDPNEQEILLTLEYTTNYKSIFMNLSDINSKLHECISAVNSGCIVGSSKLEIKFLNDTEDIVSNPIVSKIFCGFNIKVFEFKYIGKFNSAVSMYKDRIVLKNNNCNELLKDFKNELML